jgi:hypothetical protein
MTYPEFVNELIRRFGEEQGVLMAMRAEIGFLRRFMLSQYSDKGFQDQESAAIEDFLNRHPKPGTKEA